MLARRVGAGLRSALPAQHTAAAVNSRSFTAYAAAQRQKAPALADVKHDGTAEFNARQKEYREGLITAQKEKEQRESQSSPLVACLRLVLYWRRT
jgi:hypothetical protein